MVLVLPVAALLLPREWCCKFTLLWVLSLLPFRSLVHVGIPRWSHSITQFLLPSGKFILLMCVRIFPSILEGIIYSAWIMNSPVWIWVNVWLSVSAVSHVQRFKIILFFLWLQFLQCWPICAFDLGALLPLPSASVRFFVVQDEPPLSLLFYSSYFIPLLTESSSFSKLLYLVRPGKHDYWATDVFGPPSLTFLFNELWNYDGLLFSFPTLSNWFSSLCLFPVASLSRDLSPNAWHSSWL